MVHARIPAQVSVSAFLVAGFFFVCSHQASAAWIEPTCDPTTKPDDCNVAAPLNVSSAEQEKEGALNLQSTLNVEDGTVVGSGYYGVSPAPADGMIVQGLVGIGTNRPLNQLDVYGNMAVGAAFAGSRAAPADGLIVEGNVSLGTAATQLGFHTFIDGGPDSALYAYTRTGTYGVYGAGASYGVRGYSVGPYGGYFQGATYGVRGYSTGAYGGYFQGANYGVYGVSANKMSPGVYGANTNAIGGPGVKGEGYYGGEFIGDDIGAKGSGSNIGLTGDSNSGTGVQGATATGTGVQGSASGAGVGVRGIANNSTAVSGETADGTGVSGTASQDNGIAMSAETRGQNSYGLKIKITASTSYGVYSETEQPISTAIYGLAQGHTSVGVYGESNAGSGHGVYGTSEGGTGVYGYSKNGAVGAVYGRSDTARAGYFFSINGDGAYVYGKTEGLRGKSDGDALYGEHVGGDVSKFGVFCNAGVGKCGGTKAWTNTSDERLKENIKNIENPLEKLEKLRGVTFTWKGQEYEPTQMGFIAQEVLEVAPEVVSEDSEGYLTMETSQLTALLTEAIKEQQEQIEALKKIVCADHPEEYICHEK